MNDCEIDSPESADDTHPSLLRLVFNKWFFGYFLVGLVGFAAKMHEVQRKSALEQEKVDRMVEETREAVRQGQTGEAFQRLFPDDRKNFLESQR